MHIEGWWWGAVNWLGFVCCGYCVFVSAAMGIGSCRLATHTKTNRKKRKNGI